MEGCRSKSSNFKLGFFDSNKPKNKVIALAIENWKKTSNNI